MCATTANIVKIFHTPMPMSMLHKHNIIFIDKIPASLGILVICPVNADLLMNTFFAFQHLSIPPIFSLILFPYPSSPVSIPTISAVQQAM